MKNIINSKTIIKFSTKLKINNKKQTTVTTLIFLNPKGLEYYT